MKKASPTVRIVTATEAKNKFGEMIKYAYAHDEHLIVEKGGIPVVAIIPMSDYRQIVNTQATQAETADMIESASRRAAARRDLADFLKQVHARMPDVDEEETERLIQREVDAVRVERAKQMLARERKARYTTKRHARAKA